MNGANKLWLISRAAQNVIQATLTKMEMISFAHDADKFAPGICFVKVQ